MTSKRLVAAFALLAFTMVSGLAHAGAQPSDKRWWPNQTQSATVLRGEEAMAYADGLKGARVAPEPAAPKNHQYRGGPKAFH